MPYLETPNELADYLADQLGVYGAHDETCKDGKECRVCFVPEMAQRIRAAVKNENKLAAPSEL